MVVVVVVVVVVVDDDDDYDYDAKCLELACTHLVVCTRR